MFRKYFTYEDYDSTHPLKKVILGLPIGIITISVLVMLGYLVTLYNIGVLILYAALTCSGLFVLGVLGHFIGCVYLAIHDGLVKRKIYRQGIRPDVPFKGV